VVVARVIQVMTNCRSEQNAQVLCRHPLPELAQVDHTVHHLRHAEAVPEVVERVVPVVLLDAQLLAQAQRGHDRVNVELLHQAELVVHMLQQTQHL
ncbi:hypothetical protein EGW08_008342, partial [Elysia chlorotica]